MKDRMAILDTRGSGPIASRLQWITPVGYPGTKHDNSLDLHGFDIQVGEGDDPTLKLILINHSPPVNSVTGEYLDATKLGANSTVELFESKLGATTMTYVKTYDADAIDTPNSIAWIGEGEFAFTNDRSQKVGLVSALCTL
jgi:arylesterase/paraoxonase